MRVPILHPERRELAADALVAAGQALLAARDADAAPRRPRSRRSPNPPRRSRRQDPRQVSRRPLATRPSGLSLALHGPYIPPASRRTPDFRTGSPCVSLTSIVFPASPAT
jgi:hypothetical protein